MKVTLYYYTAEEKVDETKSRAFFEDALKRHYADRKTLPLRGEEENGKPCFPAEPEEQFSVSHTGRFYAVAFCRGARIGLDLQQIDPKVQPLRVARRFFSLRDVGFLERAKDPAAAFTRLWTKKEAAVKLTGEGIGALSSVREEDVFQKDLSREISERLGERLFASLACEQRCHVILVEGNQ